MDVILMAARLSSKAHVLLSAKNHAGLQFVRRMATDSSQKWITRQGNKQNGVVRGVAKLDHYSFSTFARKMENNMELDKQYERTIIALNQLQSNSQSLAYRKKRGDTKIESVLKFAERIQLTPDDIDKLNVIHVTGTKGKGSTCALTESILRHHGYKTGFFSSPHLVEVRERIRLNGKPLSRDLFNKYFWEVHDKLTDTALHYECEMPFYFGFLTLMAYHTFKRENIDVAIMEVGIGGQYDPTNIVRKPLVCGVASLGLDHTSVLGDTIEKIAWQKGGIFKHGVPAVTVTQQLSALDVLRNRAEEIGCKVYMSPEFERHELWKDDTFCLGLMGRVQEKNAALALQLSHIWLKQHNRDWNGLYGDGNKFDKDRIPILNAFPVDDQSKLGLQRCRWKGRNQILRKGGLTYYVDGAHTKESLEIISMLSYLALAEHYLSNSKNTKQCIEWFMIESCKEAQNVSGKVVKVLIFNMTGDRDFGARLKQLKSCMFDHVVFCPNNLYKGTCSQDTLKVLVSEENQLNQCALMKEVWDQPIESQMSRVSQEHEVKGQMPKFKTPEVQNLEDLGLLPVIPVELDDAENDLINSRPVNIPSSVMSCISEAIHWSTQGRDFIVGCDSSPTVPAGLKHACHIQVLVTGSIHLVGGALKLIDPDVTKD